MRYRRPPPPLSASGSHSSDLPAPCFLPSDCEKPSLFLELIESTNDGYSLGSITVEEEYWDSCQLNTMVRKFAEWCSRQICVGTLDQRTGLLKDMWKIDLLKIKALSNVDIGT